MAAVSRRAMLKGGAAALAVLPFARLQSAVGAATIPGRANFAASVGSTFQITGNGLATSAVLTEVGDLRPLRQANDPDRYSLVFALNGVLPQGTYTFTQKRIGSVNLLAAPVDRGVKAHYFQAIVNR